MIAGSHGSQPWGYIWSRTTKKKYDVPQGTPPGSGAVSNSTHGSSQHMLAERPPTN